MLRFYKEYINTEVNLTHVTTLPCIMVIDLMQRLVKVPEKLLCMQQREGQISWQRWLNAC